MPRYHFAENLKRLRMYHGYSQKEVSKRLQLSRQAYSHYERGIRLPDLEIAMTMADLYHVSLECIIKAEEPADMLIPEPKPPAVYTSQGFCLVIDDDTAQYLFSYLQLPLNLQKEIQDYASFKKRYHTQSNPGTIT